MTEPKFTPGPWHVEMVRYGCYVCNEVGLHVLTFDGSHFDTDSDIANAALIAAAPDMYAELARIEDVLEDSEDCGEISLDRIKTILRKARGESEVSE